MSEKIIVFTEEERNFIIQNVLLPANANVFEGDAFINVCEDYGFNPLYKEIIFVKYETKYGPRISYIVTKDAWIKHAKRQENFKTLKHNIVYANDDFEIDAVNGEIKKHSFGANRGEVVGAWALLQTSDGESYIEYTMLAEYANADFAKKNGSLWQSMPSRMILKTAISNVIKNTYPLGIIFRGEDELDELQLPFNNDPQVPVTVSEEVPPAAQQIQEQLQQQFTSAEPTQTTEPVAEPQPSEQVTEEVAEEVVEESVKQAETVVEPEPVAEEVQQSEPTPTEKQEETAKVEPVVQNETNVQPTEQKQVTSNPNAFTFIKKVLRQSQSGKPTTTVTATGPNGEITLHAVEELLNAFDGFVNGDQFECEYEVQFMTFNFVKTVNRLVAA